MTRCSTSAAPVAIGAAQGRQDDRARAGHDVGAVQLRRHLHGELDVAQRRLDHGVSGVAETKLPPIAMKTRASPSRIARIASTVSWPCSRGAVNSNSRSSAARKCLRRLLVDAHRAVALHVGVPAHRAHPGPGAADVALQQQHVHDIAQRRHRVLVLREPHRPAHDRRLRGAHALRPRGAAPSRARR